VTAFAFTFPGGQYHATPWGRHVNDADVAWPPEPVRILRALIATWWRKADQQAFPKAALDELIDALAVELPVFHLPGAAHTHIRAFMPTPEGKRLIFDGFLKVRPDDQLVVAWPDVSLTEDQRALAAHLLERLGYLGRGESWAAAALAPEWDGAFNAAPRTPGVTPPRGSAPVDVMVARAPADWARERAAQRDLLDRNVLNLKKSDLDKARATLPERLCDAIALDTGDWQAAGWSRPPALRKVVYDRPEIGPLPPTSGRRRQSRDPQKAPGKPEVARLLLAGRPAPRVEDTLRIGEVLRRALMARCPEGVVPPELSGRDVNGPLRGDPQHAHAFYLPEDADGDGWIDHLIVYSRIGFSDAARHALDRLTRLYIDKRGARPLIQREDEPEGGHGRKEWRVALDQVGSPAEVRSRLLEPARVWESATPYLKPRHDDFRGFDFEAHVESYRRAFHHEWELRRPGEPAPQIEPIQQQGQARFGVGPRERSPLHFVRTRPRGLGGSQPDTSGASLRLIFEIEVAGPLAFGKHAHFGLGLFVRGDDRIRAGQL
jgi:CRISPR-associated protein Csb2